MNRRESIQAMATIPLMGAGVPLSAVTQADDGIVWIEIDFLASEDPNSPIKFQDQFDYWESLGFELGGVSDEAPYVSYTTMRKRMPVKSALGLRKAIYKGDELPKFCSVKAIRIGNAPEPTKKLSVRSKGGQPITFHLHPGTKLSYQRAGDVASLTAE